MTRSARWRKLGQWAREVRVYARECEGVRDFARLMRCRLSLSKLGPVVCRHPMETTVRVRSLGGPVRVRSHTSDISVLNELVVWDGYADAARLLDAPASIVDLGANNGLAARWFLHRWPEARVVAVEPHPGNVGVLRENLALAPAGTTARVVPSAVGGSRRTAELSTQNGEYAFTLLGDGSAESVPVEVVTMADALDGAELAEIGLLKVDIEGSEQELFADCASWIGAVRQLVVECHGGYTAAALMDDCRRGGAEFRALHVDSKPEWGYEVVTAVRVTADVTA